MPKVRTASFESRRHLPKGALHNLGFDLNF
jgi:hypothetical protein